MKRTAERYMGGGLYVSLPKVQRMLGLNRKEAINLLKQQGVWPMAVRTKSGEIPTTCTQKRPRWWVERQEVKTLATMLGRPWPSVRGKLVN